MLIKVYKTLRCLLWEVHTNILYFYIASTTTTANIVDVDALYVCMDVVLVLNEDIFGHPARCTYYCIVMCQ